MGADGDHVHYLVQSTPDHSPPEIVRLIKGRTAKRIFAEHPEGQEDAVGRRVLERRVFRVHGRKDHRRGCDIGVCAKPREGEGLQATLAELVDVDTESLGGIPCRLCPREINYILRSFV